MPVTARKVGHATTGWPAQPVSVQSGIGLNAANFFLAEVTGVVMPFLNAFLQGSHWRYDAIGVATALAGLGVFVMQTPAGFIVDGVARRRTLLAGASLMLGVCYGLVPFVPAHEWLTDSILFVAGTGQAFFAPLFGALALGLAGHAALSKNDWHESGLEPRREHRRRPDGNGLGHRVRAPVGFLRRDRRVPLGLRLGLPYPPRRTGRTKGRRESRTTATGNSRPVGVRELFRDRRVVVLFAATALFHLANAPAMPLVALYVKHLEGSDRQVAAVVLVAQTVMIPAALLTGWLCDRWGRKPIFAIGFAVPAAANPALFFREPTRHTGRPASLRWHRGRDLRSGGRGDVRRPHPRQGPFQRALRSHRHGTVGRRRHRPAGFGFLVQHLGFNVAFYVFAAIAAAAASLFVFFMPETRR